MKTAPTQEQAEAWRAAEDIIAREARVFAKFITDNLTEFGVRRNIATGGSPRHNNARTKFIELISDNPYLKGWSEEFCFQVNMKHRYYPSAAYEPDKPCLVRQVHHLRFGDRSKKRVYTVLSAITYRKILGDMRALIEAYIVKAKTKQSSDEIREEWRKLKEATMSGMIVPPGLEVKIWIDPEKPPTAETVPSFNIQMKPGHSWGLNKARLTIDQVKNLVATAYVALKTQDLHVLASKREVDDSWVFWGGGYWRRYNEQCGFGTIYHSKEAAEAELDRAKGISEYWPNARVVAWTELFPHYTEIGTTADYL